MNNRQEKASHRNRAKDYLEAGWQGISFVATSNRGNVILYFFYLLRWACISFCAVCVCLSACTYACACAYAYAYAYAYARACGFFCSPEPFFLPVCFPLMRWEKPDAAGKRICWGRATPRTFAPFTTSALITSRKTRKFCVSYIY